MALRVTGILGLDGTGWQQTLLRAEAGANRFANNIRFGLGARLAGIFSVGAIGAFARKTIETASNLTDLSARTGETVEDLQRLEYTLKQNGASLEDLIGFWERLERARAAALAKPEGPQAGAFASFGLSQGDLASKSANELTRQIALKLQTASNVENLIAPLQAVGGRGVGALVASFRAGLFQMNEDIAVMSSATAESLDVLDDAFSTLGNELMANLAPGLVTIIGIIRTWVFNLKLMAEAFAGIIGAIFSGNFKSNIKQLQEDLNKMVDEEAAKQTRERVARENKIKNRTRTGGPLEFTPFDTQTKARQAKTPEADALVRVGNFLGSNRNQLQTIAERQLQISRETLQTLRNIESKISDSGDDTQFPTT